MLVVPLLAIAHVPFFGESSLQKPPDISQAYYYKSSGKLLASDTIDLLEIVSSSEDNHCILTVRCGDTELTVGPPGEVHPEPFTQSRYYKLLRYEDGCDGIEVVGVCSMPWAAVVGKGEEFTWDELLSFPVYSAKIHGSWWNRQYTMGYALALAVAASLGVGLTVLQTAAAMALALWIARLYHAVGFAASWGAVAVASTELLAIPLCYIAPKYPRAVFAAAIPLYFLGVGMYAVLLVIQYGALAELYKQKRID